MEKKGFTLVEVMAVLVILCLIMLVGVPSINRSIKRQEEKTAKQYENNLCLGAKNYARHNTIMYNNLYESKGSTSVCTKDLYDHGYISSTLKHPDTGKKEDKIKINLSYNSTNGVVCAIDIDNLNGC